jgi:DNA-binding transcriptional regulator YhcF (GntR family)
MAFRPRIHGGAGPPWRQVRDAVIAAVERGSLVPGDRLPTVRDLAAELELAPNTVARAYRELEDDGWLEGRGRAGTFVADAPPTGAGTRAQLATAAERYLRRAAQLGFDGAEARSMLDRVRATP